MRINKRSRLLLRLHGLVFAAGFLLLLVLVAWLSTRFEFSSQWTSASRMSLSESTVSLLQRMDEPMDMVAFVRPDDVLAEHVKSLAERYQRQKPDLRLQIINPDNRPDLTRELGIEGSGEILLEYRGRRERVRVPSESRVTAAMQRLHRQDNRPVVYLSGQGERSLQGSANHELGSFGNYLLESGHQLQGLEAGDPIPTEAAMLVLAGPRRDWPEQTRDWLTQYLDDGGNLLWLVDDGDARRLDFLARRLSLELVPGMLVEPRAEELLGVDNPSLLALGNYPDHPATASLQGVALFISAQALDVVGAGSGSGDGAADDHDQPGTQPGTQPGGSWTSSPLIMTDDRHWSGTGDSGKPRFDAAAGDRQGPLALGFALERSHPQQTSAGQNQNQAEQVGEWGDQRVVVVGDADFLSNAYLGNGVNLHLGLKLVDWLASGEGLVEVHGQASPDQRLNLSQPMLIGLGFGWLLALPLAFLGTAGLLWWRRRRA